MHSFEHLTGASTGGGEALAQQGILAFEIGEPQLEIEGAKIRTVAFDYGLIECLHLSPAPTGREVAGRAPHDRFQLAERSDLRSNAVGRQAQPPGLEESAPAARRSPWNSRYARGGEG